MGCDIHLYVERRQDSRWVTADKWSPNTYASDDEPHEPKMEIAYKNRFYNGRSYNLFAVLADVRNGRGFAGIKTGEGFNPIAAPKGVPEDCCPEYRAEVERWDSDGHSHSWFTVAELLAYDWTQGTLQQGYVDAAGWAQWKRDGKPQEWGGVIGGMSIKHISNEEMEAAVKASGVEMYDLLYPGRGKQQEATKAANAQAGGSLYTLVTWEEPYYKAINSQFFAETLPRLLALGKPEDVRIVFFFDN